VWEPKALEGVAKKKNQPLKVLTQIKEGLTEPKKNQKKIRTKKKVEEVPSTSGNLKNR